MAKRFFWLEVMAGSLSWLIDFLIVRYRPVRRQVDSQIFTDFFGLIKPSISSKVYLQTCRMKRMFSCFFIGVFSLCLVTTKGSAQKRISVADLKLKADSLKARFDSMSPEQKKALRQRIKARYDSLPPAEKEKIRQDLLNKIDSLTPEQRKKMARRLRNSKKDNG